MSGDAAVFSRVLCLELGIGVSGMKDLFYLGEDDLLLGGLRYIYHLHR